MVLAHPQNESREHYVLKRMGNRDRSDRPVDVLDLIARRLFSMWYYPNAHARAEAALRAPGGVTDVR